ncbi:hypothetical protein B0A49_03085 [Cryomyces minteri]|uniref:Uncharacterized protein n=1 Tax=Cryomyces minteri TaxID=331657 RepID=A0A4U0XV08_9PEZI|nr:hypothetical protein B0A49_03085 [Cryomyces minteri]
MDDETSDSFQQMQGEGKVPKMANQARNISDCEDYSNTVQQTDEDDSVISRYRHTVTVLPHNVERNEVIRKETAEHSRAKFRAIYETELIKQKIESLREQQKQELDVIRARGRRVPSEADKKHGHDEALLVKKEAELKAMCQAKEFAQRTAQEASERYKALLGQREQELTEACKMAEAMSKELQKLKGKAAAV